MASDEGDPRTRMIVVAERLFAERGIGAVSLREVGAEAGQRNNSAVQYHFGSKSGLVQAIFDYRQSTIDRRREGMLRELDAGGRGDDLPSLVEALVRPLAEAITGEEDGESWYARFIAQILASSEGGESPHVLSGSVAEVYRRIERSMSDRLPKRVRRARLWLAGSFMVNALAERERTMAAPGRESGLERLSSDFFVTDLIDTSIAILESPIRATRSARTRPATATRPSSKRSQPRTRRGESTSLPPTTRPDHHSLPPTTHPDHHFAGGPT